MLMCDYKKMKVICEKSSSDEEEKEKIWIKGNEMDVLKAMEWNE